MRTAAFIFFTFLFVLGARAQKGINKVPVNELELNSSVSDFEYDVFLITGEEEIYASNPNLRENVLRNIANGIREGLYDGYKHSTVDGVRASRTTLFFYKDELYKVRWFFLKQDLADFEQKAKQLNSYLTEKYGPGDEQIPDFLTVWQGKKRYIQSFSEESDFQIEYRDEKIHEKVEKLKQ